MPPNMPRPAIWSALVKLYAEDNAFDPDPGPAAFPCSTTPYPPVAITYRRLQLQETPA